ncbi:acylphosphatase [Patescibacteria group bacterium]|nr:acylphosphatase [Patescibacteria group bacterium]MBU4512489.1 acylphosphatase [Patescibacteria group bacterium]MCG2692805.1 acylphosphatase [Candidatus Parcubacteria bacterium]
MPKHLNIKIFGQVQGVFFRDSAKRMADDLDIKGFVKNDSDGAVYIEAEGEESDLNEFLAWCRQGTDLARVEKIDVVDKELKNFNDFSIKL